MTYIVYILYSEKLDRFYVGRTSNLYQRLEQHAAGKSQFTKAGIPWTLYWSDFKSSEHQAYLLERKLKNLTRKRKAEFMIKYQEGLADSDLVSILQERFLS